MNAPAAEPQRTPLLLLIPLLLFFTVVMLRNAWVAEDAFITFRTVDNFVNGHGLRWNVSERVQTYTHPLWLILFTPIYFFTRQAFFTSIAFCALFSIANIAILIRRVAVTPQAAVLAVVVLTFSKAFMDYSNSGLENPLSHLILVLFAIVFLNATTISPRRACACAALASLAFLARPDHILIYAPALFVIVFSNLQRRNFRSIPWLALGFLPAVLWVGFSLFYYGFPFPNTAYAKVVNGSGFDAILHRQGLYYYWNSLKFDPITLTTAAAGVLAALLSRNARSIQMTLGVLLYCLYVLHIGGDFMSGRFFTIVLLFAVIMLARIPWGWRLPRCFAFPLVPLLLLGATARLNPVASDSQYPMSKGLNPYFDTQHRGITDERGYYYNESGLLSMQRGKPVPSNPLAEQGRAFRARATQREIIQTGWVGNLGYFGGPLLHIVDYLGVTDPLLARIPVGPGDYQRPGHIERRYSPDYIQTLRTGKNHLRDPQLKLYYDKLNLILSGPLFSSERMLTILKMNTGAYRPLIADYSYAETPLKFPWKLSELATPSPDGADWMADSNLVFSPLGAIIDLETPRHNALLEISINPTAKYIIFLRRAGANVARLEIQPLAEHDGMQTLRLANPSEAAAAGYDTLRVFPRGGNGHYAIGHLVLH